MISPLLHCWRPGRRAAAIGLAIAIAATNALATVPVRVEPVVGRHGVVVAGHPQAAAIGVDVLKAGGNAIDAAVAVSLALGVAEPYGSGLGGKLMLLYYDASTGRIHAVDGMDAAGSVEVTTYVRRPLGDRDYGYGSVCVPGLAAGLWAAHRRWGRLPWAQDVAPSIQLARAGFEVLPKSVQFFLEKEERLRRGDAEIARLYLPGGRLPEAGTLLANPDLAHTLELVARHGRDGFYRGPVAAAIVAASQRGGGVLTLDDFARYEPRVEAPIAIDFRGYRIVSGPPPTNGPPLLLTVMKVLEPDSLGGGPLRTAVNLDRIGRVWRLVRPVVQDEMADVPAARHSFERLVAPDSMVRFRREAGLDQGNETATIDPDADGVFAASALASTTHFLVADADGNIVCATQSLSLHFGAAVVAPGTGVVLNDTMSDFAYGNPQGVNYPAPGKRPRSTISPTIVLRDGRPVLAIGIPGGSRIPTAVLQALLDRLVLKRSLADAIGDTRVHWDHDWRRGTESIKVEASCPPSVAAALRRLGWKVDLVEPAGTGHLFGGITAIEVNPDGGYTGYADPRRTNAAAAY